MGFIATLAPAIIPTCYSTAGRAGSRVVVGPRNPREMRDNLVGDRIAH